MQTARSSSALPGASLTPAHSHGCSEGALSFADVLGRKNSLLILGLPFSSFRKHPNVLQKEGGSRDAVSQRESLVALGWFMSYVILVVLSDRSQTSYLTSALCVYL